MIKNKLKNEELLDFKYYCIEEGRLKTLIEQNKIKLSKLDSNIKLKKSKPNELEEISKEYNNILKENIYLELKKNRIEKFILEYLNSNLF